MNLKKCSRVLSWIFPLVWNTLGHQAMAHELDYTYSLRTATQIKNAIESTDAEMNLPDLGASASQVLSPAQERRLGEQIMQNIRQDNDYIDDDVILAYLNTLGYRLVAVSPDNRINFDFFIVKDTTMNAFALPGGFIGVHTGLFSATQGESELAAVLAHEIAHVTQKHLTRLVNNQQQIGMTTIAAIALAILAARSGNGQATQAAVATAQAGAIQSRLNFTRQYEHEADRTGFNILQKSGFDVRGMSRFFERLQKGGRLYENNAPAYLKTHPLTTERIADVQNRAQNAPYRQVQDSLEYLLIKARIRALYDPEPRDQKQFFLNQLAQNTHPTHQLAAYYGLFLVTNRLNQLQETEKYAAMLSKSRPHPITTQSLLQFFAKNTPSADKIATEYEQKLKVFSTYKPLLYDYIQFLIQKRMLVRAEKLINQQLDWTRSDPKLFTLQAELYANLGKNLLRHQAQAESYYLLGNLHAAIEQLELAQRAGDGDFYQQSSVEARLKQLKQLKASYQTEEKKKEQK